MAASAAAMGVVLGVVTLHGLASERHQVPASAAHSPSALHRGAPTPPVVPASPTASPSASHRESPTTPVVAACHGSQLSAKIVDHAGGMSQSLDEIALTNDGPRPCRLSGYPKLAAWGSIGAGPRSKLKLSLTNEANTFISDPGPTTVDIAPGKFAWFGLSAATAYGSELITIDRLAIIIATGSGLESVDLPITLAASRAEGKAIPISVTAFAGGRPLKPGS
jgi:hypothetical protein